MRLRIRPKQAGEFQMLIRGWICADEYTNCSRQPPDGPADQQGYIAAPLNITVTAQGAPDLVVVNPWVDKYSVEAGEEFEFGATVRNQGAGSAAGTLLRYYRSSDSHISRHDDEVADDDVDALDPSETHGRLESLDAPSVAGTYYYGACVDAVSGESDTGNNCSQGVRVEVAGDPPRLSLSSTPTSSSVRVGEWFSLTVQLELVSGSGDHGGISVSFPRLTAQDTDSEVSSYTSNVAEVELNSYSHGPDAKVTFFDSTKDITYSDNTTRRANHLLVESDYSSWSSSDISPRYMTLRIKPKSTGTFRIKVRGWLCADEYESCTRIPDPSYTHTMDQQGWRAIQHYISVTH